MCLCCVAWSNTRQGTTINTFIHSYQLALPSFHACHEQSLKEMASGVYPSTFSIDVESDILHDPNLALSLSIAVKCLLSVCLAVKRLSSVCLAVKCLYLSSDCLAVKCLSSVCCQVSV